MHHLCVHCVLIPNSLAYADSNLDNSESDWVRHDLSGEMLRVLACGAQGIDLNVSMFDGLFDIHRNRLRLRERPVGSYHIINMLLAPAQVIQPRDGTIRSQKKTQYQQEVVSTLQQYEHTVEPQRTSG